MGREDFRSASPFEKGTDSGHFNWVVYGDYELVERDEQRPYFRVSSDERAKFYQPLAHTPYLFLEFARIAEQRGQLDEGLNQWIRKYGMLGLSSYRPNGPLEPPAWEYWALNTDLYPEVIFPPLRYTSAGGPGDNLDVYRLEAAKTNKLLTLYETLRNRDITGLEQCFALHEGCTPEGLREKWRAEPGKSMEDNLRLKESNSVVMNILDDALVYDSVPGDWNAYLMNRAIVDIWVTVGSALSIFAHPSITFLKSSGLITGAVSPENLTGTWRVRNLLGAIYLQFFWLVTSTGELSRCKHCGRIIAYAPPMPESAGRKPRKDKEFCDSRCRQNYHYHNRIKPTRNPM